MQIFLVKFLILIAIITAIIMYLLYFGNSDGSRYVYKGNTKYKIIDIKSNEYQCSECNMDVEELDYAVQLISKNGNTYFFDDIGCIVLWLENHSMNKEKILTKTVDTHKWMNIKKVWYSRIASSPMGYGFAAFEHNKKSFILYNEMKQLMLNGENLHNPSTRKRLLGK